MAAATSPVDILRLASCGEAPAIAPMPPPSFRALVEMRDGVRLSTSVWFPKKPGPFPTILIRTPYREEVTGWLRLGALRYCEAGYAVTFQLVRGIAPSEGAFSFNNLLDRSDGYDTVEWLAHQSWCDGAVGMDGSSYAGMTQLSAAIVQPPSLKCIVPTVVSCDFFRHGPRFGGAFLRQHTLGWSEIVSANSLEELTRGLWGPHALLRAPQSWSRLQSRPAIEAADGVLEGDWLRHYRDVLTHSTHDDWWRDRTLQADDYARITVPVFVISGNYDASTGSQYLWAQLERHAPERVERLLLIGPWDHGGAYVSDEPIAGPWPLGKAAAFDIFAARLAFFDKHLKGEGAGPDLKARTAVYISGRNEWLLAEKYPAPQVSLTPIYLRSDAPANLRGNGALRWRRPENDEPPDGFVADPFVPFLPVANLLDPARAWDLTEIERSEDVLVFTSEALVEPLTLLGTFHLELYISADAPDCDFICWLAEGTPEGAVNRLSQGILRVRYREGFEREIPLVPGVVTLIVVEMAHVAHELNAGTRLRLLIGASDFPLIDPNPNTGEPIASGRRMQRSRQYVHHDRTHASRIHLPVLADARGWPRKSQNTEARETTS